MLNAAQTHRQGAFSCLQFSNSLSNQSWWFRSERARLSLWVACHFVLFITGQTATRASFPSKILLHLLFFVDSSTWRKAPLLGASVIPLCKNKIFYKNSPSACHHTGRPQRRLVPEVAADQLCRQLLGSALPHGRQL